ncbi:MAG: class I SAM-dependent methyltransferase, partial [Pseudomonadales bacterium]
WRERYEANSEKVREMFDENFERAWRLYLSGSISAFTNGQLQLFQVLFQRPHSTSLPITRERMLTASTTRSLAASLLNREAPLSQR